METFTIWRLSQDLETFTGFGDFHRIWRLSQDLETFTIWRLSQDLETFNLLLDLCHTLRASF